MSGNTEPERPGNTPRRRSRFAGFVGLVEVLRTLPERLKRPEALLMLLAIFASLFAHMPPYVGLGALADYFAAHPPPAPIPPSEVSFEIADPSAAPEMTPEPAPPAEEKPKPKPEKKKPELAKRAEPLKPVAPEPEQKKPELELKKPVSEVTVAPPPKADPRKQSITQKSADPDVEPPPNAQFLAEQNQRVEEETVAKITDPSRDDPEPVAAAPQAPGEEAAGDADEDQRPVKSSNERAQKPEPQVAATEPSRETPREAPQKPVAPRKEEAAQAPQPVIIHDPLGSFALVPAQPARAAQSARAGRQGSDGQPAQQPNIKVTWRAFEETFGAEQLAQDRMPKEAKRRGAGREKRWSEFRAAVENYVAGVKPGNTTALNAAADPFAAYLAAFHRNLHIEFAHEYLGSLPMMGELGDPNLVTKVEIVVNADGTLDRVGVVGSSGNMMYDFGAFNAVQRGAPYPPTPEKIRSPDGRVYLRWALHRNESQCGTWNAEPYILRTPPRSPNDPPEDNVSPYRTVPGDRQGSPKPTPTNGPAKAVAPGETLGMGRGPRRARA